MKRSKKILGAALVLVVLLSAYGVVRYVQSRSSDSAAAETSAPAATLLELEQDSIVKMVLDRPDDTLTLTRSGESWEVDYPHPINLRLVAVQDLLYSFSRLQADKLIEENPEDLSQYGLSEPAVSASVFTQDGTKHTVLLGNRAPSGYAYYMKTEESDTVYTVTGSHGYHFLYELADLRVKALVDEMDYQNLQRFFLKTEETAIEIVPKDPDEIFYEDVMGPYKMVRPYRVTRGVDTENFLSLLENLPQFSIKDFIDDDPGNLTQYGLEEPTAEFIAEDQNGNRIHLLLGKVKDEFSVFAKQAEAKKVFTLDSSSVNFIAAKPFELVAKFALIVPIDSVDRILIQTRDDLYEVDINREIPEEAGEDAEPLETFFLNGHEIEDKTFREYYQTHIGLVVDDENPYPTENRAVLTLTYILNEKARDEQVSVSFVPYNRDFYQVYRDGTSEFVIAREAVHRVIERTEALVRAESGEE